MRLRRAHGSGSRDQKRTHFYNGYADAETSSYRVNGPDVYDSEDNHLSTDGGTTVNVAVEGHYENWSGRGVSQTAMGM